MFYVICLLTNYFPISAASVIEVLVKCLKSEHRVLKKVYQCLLAVSKILS